MAEFPNHAKCTAFNAGTLLIDIIIICHIFSQSVISQCGSDEGVREPPYSTPRRPSQKPRSWRWRGRAGGLGLGLHSDQDGLGRAHHAPLPPPPDWGVQHRLPCQHDCQVSHVFNSFDLILRMHSGRVCRDCTFCLSSFNIKTTKTNISLH